MIWEFDAKTTVTVADHETLRAFWKSYRGAGATHFVRRIYVEKPLTEAQSARLPAQLRSKVRNVAIRLDDSVEFLETLYRLEDPR